MKFSDLMPFRYRHFLRLTAGAAANDDARRTETEVADDANIDEITSILDKGEISNEDLERLARLIGNE